MPHTTSPAPGQSTTDPPLAPGAKCPLSGSVVVGIPREDWINSAPYRCHMCGSLVTYRVRDADYAGMGRLHSHKVPKAGA